MDALIGHTGLVGSTIARARTFDAYYRSTDIDSMRGRSFDLVVCAGVRAEKWLANRDPVGDAAGIARLTDVLETVQIGQLVLISSVDVYPSPSHVDELTAIDPTEGHPYGRHRLALERLCAARFGTTVVRLPGLCGQGLKKNAIFDLFNENAVDRIHPDSTFQFYDLTQLWHDIERLRAAGIALVNLTAEPVSMREVAAEAFDRVLYPAPDVSPAAYDVRSRYAEQFGGSGGYWYDRAATLGAISRFVSDERARRGTAPG